MASQLIRAGTLCAAAWAGSMGAVAGQTAPGAPETSFRIVTTDRQFTPLQSYAAGETHTGVLFFGGLSGMGLHTIFGGQIAFPSKAYNRSIVLYDPHADQTTLASIDHLPDAIREALLISNVGHAQIDGTLYLFGGYGILLDGSNWTTRDTITAIDLQMIEDAIRGGAPIPAEAFEITTSPMAQTSGGIAVKLGGSRIKLVGGAKHTGDYGGIGPAYELQYVVRSVLYDVDESLTEPEQVLFTIGDEFIRRDMNCVAAMLPDDDVRTPGFIITGGVFNGIFPWETPVRWCDGDTQADVDHAVRQKMNQYEGPRVSFWSPAHEENRVILFSGLSANTWNGTRFIPDFSTPWTTEITQMSHIGDAWVTTPDPVNPAIGIPDQVIGQMPLPVTNAELIIDERIPRAPNGQVLLDELPAAEVLLGRIYGGLHAAMPAPAPPTYASGTVYDVFVTTGLEGDVSRDGVVNALDLAELLTRWGSDATIVDFNLDGVVDAADLAFILEHWGNQPSE